MTYEQSCQLRTLHQIGGVKICEIIHNRRKYPGFAKFPIATIYRHAKKPIDGTEPFDRRKVNKGRPAKLSVYDRRVIGRQVAILRNDMGTFSSTHLQQSCGIKHVSNTTVRRCLHDLGYGYRRTRKKGILKPTDLRKRLEFVRKIQRMYQQQSMNLWTYGISMYVDAVGYEYKTNPYEHAKTPCAREWRMKNEGLDVGCTTKGSKEGCKQVKFLVGMAHNVGVVLCKELTQPMSGTYYAELVLEAFPTALERTMNARGKRVLLDGDPSQNSRRAKQALDQIGAKVFSIPPRSPDLNPIENLFNIIRMKLRKEARDKHITHETKGQFSRRVVASLTSMSSEQIDRIIETMPKRLQQIQKAKGQRIKY